MPGVVVPAFELEAQARPSDDVGGHVAPGAGSGREEPHGEQPVASDTAPRAVEDQAVLALATIVDPSMDALGENEPATAPAEPDVKTETGFVHYPKLAATVSIFEYLISSWLFFMRVDGVRSACSFRPAANAADRGLGPIWIHRVEILGGDNEASWSRCRSRSLVGGSRGSTGSRAEGGVRILFVDHRCCNMYGTAMPRRVGNAAGGQ